KKSPNPSLRAERGIPVRFCFCALATGHWPLATFFLPAYLMSPSSRLRWLWLTLAVVLLDRATKAWFEAHTVEGWRREIIHNFIYLVTSRNPGITFGVLAASASAVTRAILITGSLAVIAVLAWLLVTGKIVSAMGNAGLALLLGGAAGNVSDRIFHGAVTDFFEMWL